MLPVAHPRADRRINRRALIAPLDESSEAGHYSDEEFFLLNSKLARSDAASLAKRPVHGLQAGMDRLRSAI